jgi:hypothetical protein
MPYRTTAAGCAEPLPLFADGGVDLILNWGLGVDSTACFLRMLEDPVHHGLDLRRTAVIHMVTGDEWPDTVSDAERFVLPVLREHGVRLVQLARSGRPKAAGIDVVDDSRHPTHIVRRGRWALWDEMEANGTVPQQGGVRLCSLHAKAEVADHWIGTATGGRPYTQILGFNADEARRVRRDESNSQDPMRKARFPLISWGWGRQQCEEYLFERFKVAWKKSYCSFCCFPVSMGAMAAHLDRMRSYPHIAGRVLRLEFTSMALNPNSRLFGEHSLLEQFDPCSERDSRVLEALEEELAACPWALYHVRRILPISRTDPSKRAPALRSVHRITTGSVAQVAEAARERAHEHAVAVEENPRGSVRVWVRTRGAGFPATEELYVTAPAFVHSKQLTRFEAEWAAHTNPAPVLR